MKKKSYLCGYLAGFIVAMLIVILWSWAESAPLSQIFRSLVPENDNEFFVGTTSPSNVRWRALNLGTGTSTAANGFNITDGCFSVNGTCLSATGISGSGSANRLAYFTGASALSSDADFVIDADLGRLTTTYASSTALTATYASSTALTATNLFSTNASSTYLSTSQNIIVGNSLVVPGIVSAIPLTNANGVFSAYAGTSCTNQFPRSLSALGAATCASVANTDLTNSTISGVALGGTLGALTATNGTLTFSASYTGAAAATVGLNLGSANEWTASTTFSGVLNVEALLLTASGTISVLNTNTALIASTTIQRANLNACGGDGCGELFSFTVASSSSLFTTSVPLPTKRYNFTVIRIACYVTGGTSKVITMTDGTNAMDSLTCLGTETLDDGSIANNTVTSGELMKITMGAGVGAVDAVSVTIQGIRGQ